MRKEMLSRKDLSAAVFIGGMEGVIHEYDLFTHYHPAATILPVASPGGAARELAIRLGYTSQEIENTNFPKIFHDALGISCNDPRMLSGYKHSCND